MDETSKAIEMRSTKLPPENYYANWPFKVRKVGLGGEDERGSRYQTFNQGTYYLLSASLHTIQ